MRKSDALSLEFTFPPTEGAAVTYNKSIAPCVILFLSCLSLHISNKQILFSITMYDFTPITNTQTILEVFSLICEGFITLNVFLKYYTHKKDYQRK